MAEVDAFMAEQLLLMGFDQEQVTAALIATNNASVDAALEALLNQTYHLQCSCVLVVASKTFQKIII